MSDFIPEDVVVDILSRLPTKSLIRFRSVSKLWNSLITGPNFINSHLNHSLTNPKNSYDNLPLAIVRQCIAGPPPEQIRLEHYKLFIDTGEEDNTLDEYLEIPFPLKSRRLHYHFLMGYVKGLFCVFEQDNYFLWNPSIRKSITLPKPDITKKTHGRLAHHLAFGYDPRCNDYKVVRIVILCGGNRSEEVPIVQVYSLNAGSWKINRGAENSFPPGFRIQFASSHAACLDGAIHWGGEASWNAKDRWVLSFDLSDEVFKTISLPNELTSARFNIRTSVFGGLLALLCDDDFDRANKSCSIWIMKEYGIVDSWYKYVKVDLTGGIKGVIGILKNGHILIEGDTSWSWELSSYDPRNKEIKKLGIKGTIGRFHVDTYEENLILLNKTDALVSRRGGCRKRKDRLMLDQSTHARMEAQALATDAKRLKQEFVVLRETVEGKMGVVREVVAKMWPQQFTELRSKLQANFPNFLTKDGQGNEETNSTRLTSTSQNSVVKDCEVAEKLSHSCVLGRGENVKGNHSNGCTSSGQGCSDKDRTRDEDMEFWRKDLEFWRKDLEGWIKLKAEYAHFLEQISEFDQILRTILP